MSMAPLPRTLRIFAWAAASVCVSAALVAGAEPPAPQAAITSLAGSLAAVSAGSATDAWAVGQTRTRKTLALHWNGTSWAQVSTPAPGAFGSLLSGVTEISPANVWAVGSANTSSGGASLVLHWNGRKWAQVPTPSAGISGLSGVSAVSATDIWAVGSGGTTTRETTLVLHWDGRTWTRIPSPTPPGQVVALFAVSAVSATDAWAVGRDLTATTGKTLVLHWDGRAWTQVSSPSPGATDNQLLGVHMTSATDGWAVGLTTNSLAQDLTLVLHWDGAAWTQVSSPSPGATDNQLLGVHMTSATDGWAVGLTTNSLAQDLTLVLHWDGAAWTQVSSPSFGLSNGGSQLTAVSALTGSDAWASGLVFTNGGGEGTLLLHWDGKTWTRVAAPSPSPGGATGGSFLDGVHMTATADVWSAGGTFFDSTGREQTLLLHWDGKTWTRF